MIHGEKGTVEYGVNVEESAFSSDPDDKLGTSNFNLKNLPRLPQSPLRLLDRKIPGLTDPMLYIGMLFSMFARHVEKTVLDHVYCNKILAEHGLPSDQKVIAGIDVAVRSMKVGGIRRVIIPPSLGYQNTSASFL